MMKKYKIIFAMFLVLSFIATGAYAAKKDTKIGFVDLSRLFDEYHRTKDYDKILEAEHKGFEKERNAKIEKIRESNGKLSLLTDDKKGALEEEIEQLKAELLEYDRQKKEDMTKKRNEKIRELLLEIEKVVSDYAEAEKYTIMLNDRVLIYGNQEFNETENILKILNKN